MLVRRTINEWNKLSTDCETASSVNMFQHKADTYKEGGLHTYKIMLDSRYANGLLVRISSGLCRDGNLVKSC